MMTGLEGLTDEELDTLFANMKRERNRRARKRRAARVATRD